MNKPVTAVSNLGAIDAAHHLHPFSDMKKLNATGTKIITRAEGVHIWDATGKQYLDAFAGLWCVNVGYGRKSIADVVHAQMLELPYYNTFFGTTTPPTHTARPEDRRKDRPEDQPRLLLQFRLGSLRHLVPHGARLLEGARP